MIVVFVDIGGIVDHHRETTAVPTNSAIFNKDEEDRIAKFVNNHNSERNSKNTK